MKHRLSLYSFRVFPACVLLTCVLLAGALGFPVAAFADEHPEPVEILKPGGAPVLANGVPVIGSDAAACDPARGEKAVLLFIDGLRGRNGFLIIELYSDRPEDFLAPRQRLQAQGRLFRRVQTGIPQSGPVYACMQLPGPGRYTMVVFHDRNSSTSVDVWSEGFGFPNNPKLGLSKPSAASATFTAEQSVTRLYISVNYVFKKGRYLGKPPGFAG